VGQRNGTVGQMTKPEVFAFWSRRSAQLDRERGKE
jgi:hypothetical protein